MVDSHDSPPPEARPPQLADLLSKDELDRLFPAKLIEAGRGV